jgi:hypothetical protein
MGRHRTAGAGSGSSRTRLIHPAPFHAQRILLVVIGRRSASASASPSRGPGNGILRAETGGRFHRNAIERATVSAKRIEIVLSESIVAEGQDRVLSLPWDRLLRARRIVASRQGAAGYKLMRQAHVRATEDRPVEKPAPERPFQLLAQWRRSWRRKQMPLDGKALI